MALVKNLDPQYVLEDGFPFHREAISSFFVFRLGFREELNRLIPWFSYNHKVE